MPLGFSFSLENSNSDVWIIKSNEINDKNILIYYISALDNMESEKYNDLHVNSRKHQYLVTRGALRYILTSYESNISPSDWSFINNKHGRPYIENDMSSGELFFNISHTDDIILIAISRIEKLGVDIENVSKKRNISQIAKNYFSSKEIEAFEELPIEEKNDRFFALWTLKEAYVKACGKGLAIPLNAFNYTFNNSSVRIDFTSSQKDEPGSWLLWHLSLYQDYRYSIAMGEAHHLNNEFSINIFELHKGAYKKKSTFDLISGSELCIN